MKPPEEVTRRWKELASLSDLTAGRRLATKVSMSPEAVSGRLRQVEELRRTCLAFARGGLGSGLNTVILVPSEPTPQA